MNMRITEATLCLVSAVALTGCSTWKKFDRTEKGAVIGGGAGALVGSAIAPGVGGTIVGGAVGAAGGGLIGHETEEKEERKKR